MPGSNGLDRLQNMTPAGQRDVIRRAARPIRQRVVIPLVASRHIARLLRLLPHNRRFPDDGSATVVIVNWESLEYLAVAVEAIRRYSPDDLQILVVDNGSTDGSRKWLRRNEHVRSLLLPVNIHHGPAMDLGFSLSRTQYVISMDVDAFPLSIHWLHSVLEPLQRGCLVSGVVSQRNFVHPCLLAMERQVFVRGRHTFRSRRGDYTTSAAWDTGELITRRCEPAVHRISATSHIGPYWVGTSWEGVAYHNMYAVRHLRKYGAKMNSADATIDWGITRRDAERAWEIATRQYLGLDASSRERLTQTPQ